MKCGGSTTKFSPLECKGLKLAISSMCSDGSLVAAQDRKYKEVVESGLKTVKFLPGATKEKQLAWMRRYNASLDKALDDAKGLLFSS